MQPKPAAKPARTPAPHRPPLRLIPGGFDPAAWPLHTRLQPHEPLYTWWARCAHRFGISGVALLRETHMRKKPLNPAALERILASNHRAIATLTRVPHTARTRNYQEVTDRTSRDAILEAHFHPPLILHTVPGSRYCPACLKEHGTWNNQWRDPYVIACTEHSCYLQDDCPDCRQRPFSSTAWAFDNYNPITCPEYLPTGEHTARRRRTRCAAPIADTALRPAQQQVIDAAALLYAPASKQPVHVAGLPCTTDEARQALQLLILDGLRRAPKPARGQSEAIAALEAPVLAAMSIIQAPTLTAALSAANDAGVLGADSPLVPLVPARALRDHPTHPALHAIALTRLDGELPSAAQLRCRVGTAWPAPPRDGRHRHTTVPVHAPRWGASPVPFDVIPAYWPRDGLPGFPLPDSPKTRFAISVAVAAVGRNMPLGRIAENLGVPPQRVSRITATWRRISADKGWTAFRTAIYTVADQLLTL